MLLFSTKKIDVQLYKYFLSHNQINILLKTLLYVTLSIIPISVENLLIILPKGVFSKKFIGHRIKLLKSFACKIFLAKAPAYCPNAFDEKDNAIETIDNTEYAIKYWIN